MQFIPSYGLDRYTMPVSDMMLILNFFCELAVPCCVWLAFQ